MAVKFLRKTILRVHVKNYYKHLFGREERGGIRLQDETWENEGSLEECETLGLVEEFSEKEINEAPDEMKTNSAPDPDGFSTGFYKVFWE
jgi:hypothetical protein